MNKRSLSNLVRQKSKWSNLPAKPARFPEIFLTRLEEIALAWDRGEEIQIGETTKPTEVTFEVIMSYLQDLSLEELLTIEKKIPQLIEEKREGSKDRTIEKAIVLLANHCDGAAAEDGQGFNKADSYFGKWLAEQIKNGEKLTPKQARSALKMLGKYQKTQLQDFKLPSWEAVSHQYETRISLLPEEAMQAVLLLDTEIVCKFPYDRDLVDFVKQISTKREYNSGDRSWRFPLSEAKKVKLALEDRDFWIDPQLEGIILDNERQEAEKLEQQANKEEIFLKDTSKLIESAKLEEKLPCGWNLFKHQKEGAAWLLSKRKGGSLKGGILADHMGLGKTIAALVAARAMQKTQNLAVFVICPASLKANWLREAEKVGVAIEIFSWAKMPQPLESKQYLAIADECFLYNTPIITSIGVLPIGEIVENNLLVSVLSCDIERNVLEWKPVSRWISKERNNRLVKITHEFGELFCTENHKIWTEECGYVEAGTLKGGESLRILPQGFSDSQEREGNGEVLLCELFKSRQIFKSRNQKETFRFNSTAISGESLLVVRSNFPDEKKQDSERKEKILLSNLLEFSQSKFTRRERKIEAIDSTRPQSKQGEKETRCKQKDEEKQPYEGSRNKNQSLSIFARANFSVERWELEIDGTSNNFSQSIGIAEIYGICDKNQGSKNRVSELAPMLQSRYCLPQLQTSDRGGRAQSQIKKTEIFGSSKNRSFKRSRVVSLEVLERGNIDRFGISHEESKRVYNLEVEHNHNYFANNVLVSNCHYAQNIKSARTKRLLELANNDNCESIWLLSGTPIKNGRPVNLFPLLKAIEHPLSKEKKDYEKRYCAAGYKSVGSHQFWDNTGAAHLDELAEKTNNCILRRTKKDCLDLPEKQRIMVECELEKNDLLNYQSEISGEVAEYRRRVKAGEVCEEAQALVTLGILRRIGSAYKVDAALEKIEELLEQDRQVVVFTEFLQSAEMLYKQLKKVTSVELLTGATKNDDRQEIVDRFQSGETKIFVGTIKAGGVGLTLTSASDVILLDRPWTPGDAEQAEDRCHRIGQSTSVSAFWLQLGEIDETIDQLLQKKQERIDLVLQGKRKTLRGIGSPKQLAKELLNAM